MNSVHGRGRFARRCPRRLCGGVLAVVAVGLFGACSSDDSATSTTAPTTPAATAEGSAGCSPARPADAGTAPKTFMQGDRERTYLLTIPEAYDGTTPAPIIVNLHGALGTGEKVNTSSQMPEKAGERGYIVVAPDALSSKVETGGGEIEGGIWNLAPAFADPMTGSTTTVQAEMAGDDDIAFINGLLDSLEQELCVDTAREYAAGKSAGAGMTTFLSCQPSPRFAAVAPVAGVNMPKFCVGSDVPPMITFHGDADRPMPYAGGTVVGIDLGVPDVDTRVDEVAAKGQCEPPTEEQIADDVVHRVWSCPDGNAVELYKVLGGGHTWPGEDPSGVGTLGVVTDNIDATELMLDFFDQHTKA